MIHTKEKSYIATHPPALKLDLHMLFRLLQAVHAMTFLVLMSVSVLYIHAPKYLNSLTCFQVATILGFNLHVKWQVECHKSCFLCIHILCNPSRRIACSTLSNNNWAWAAVFDSSAISSAKSESVMSYCGRSFFPPPINCWSQSIIKRDDANILNSSDSQTEVVSFALVSLWEYCIASTSISLYHMLSVF